MSGGTGSALPVLNDPQFGLTAILRPYVGFDSQLGPGTPGSYQGINGSIPIMFTEGGVALDAFAGKPGYSKELVKGLGVPFGARISVWLPIVGIFSEVARAYAWFFIWRQRNVLDYRVQRIPFHYPKQGLGVPDTTPTDQPPERIIIPAAAHSIIVNDLAPPAGFPASSGLRPELFIPGLLAEPSSAPQVPSGNSGVIQQGLLDPNVFANAAVPMFQTVEVQALGDELLIACTKPDAANWDFSTLAQDAVFSLLFGANAAAIGGFTTPFVDIGVYVNAGVAT